LYVSQGTLSLSGNAFTVNSASPLGIGQYTLVKQASGNITSSGTYPAVTGSAIGFGSTGTITVTGDSVFLNVTAPLLATQLIFTSTPVSTTAGVASAMITVQRQDGGGNPLAVDPSITVTLSSDSSGTKTFTPASLTIPNGSSSATFTYTDTKAGTPTLTAAYGGLTPAMQQETVTVGAAAKLEFTTQPGGGTAGSAWTTQPVVTVQDAYGNTVTDSSAPITLTIKSGTGTGTLSGTTTVDAINGVATFSGLSLDLTGTGYQLSAAGAGLTGADSSTSSITGGTATSLTVSGFPSPQPAGQSASVTVTAKDVYGNTATGYTGTVSLTSSDGAAILPSSHVFTGPDAGIYHFSDVILNTLGTQSLTAGDGTFTATQSGISVTVAPLISTFTTNGTWTAPAGVTAVQLLVVAGGGAGGRGGAAGGGGAGGLIYYGSETPASANSYSVTPGTTYTVTVGAGGAYGGYNNGGNSSFGAVVATGGGAGGNNWSFGTLAGATGGSGGGGGIGGWSSQLGGAASPAGQGYAGGASSVVNAQIGSAGGGGGGAGAVGSNSSFETGGNGGAGLAYSISGSSVTYAGGGGGTTFASPPYPVALVQGQGGAGYLNAGGGGMAQFPSGVNAGTSGQKGIVIVTYVLSNPYQAWLAENSLTDTPEALKHYAFGTTTPGAIAVTEATHITLGQTPAVQITGGVASAVFGRRTDSTGLTYTVEFSSTLGDWHPGTDTANLTYEAGAVLEPAVVATQGAMEAVSVPFPISIKVGEDFVSVSKLFMRIVVMAAP
ncbi:MAG: glycine-rich domain-containing protein, partial [Verrucomicrobiota bacterium]